ncbi:MULTISPECIES: helix-turn-helix domain-containing protein [unclassified Variovorax]|uniref:helix-turn-helix domain-containing protein n=1 Tax=unclassified Variovorax TaxID=663243 RepID=UPI0032E60FCC
MTPEELAERASLHVNYIGSLERGERNVSVFNIWLIANSLGLTSPNYLLIRPCHARRPSDRRLVRPLTTRHPLSSHRSRG